MHTNDLTSGPIARPLATIALPLLIGSILQQLYNTIDAFIIGRYVGQTAFAAIGVAGTVMNLFIFILSGCCTGISIVLAQLYGRKDDTGFRNAGFLSVTTGSIFTICLSGLSILIQPFLLKWMQTPPDVAQFARIYLNIIFGGLICTFLYNYCAATLRAVGNTQAALFILAGAMLGNLVLDYLFVAIFRWGIAGAAWATIIAQFLAAFTCFLYMRSKLTNLLFGKADFYYNGPLLKRVFNYSAVSALHQSSLYIGKLLVQGAVNTTGIDGISAYTAATRIEGFINSFSTSCGEAVSIFVAQNIGAGNRERARCGFYTGLVFMFVLGVSLSTLMALSAPYTAPFLLGESGTAAASHAIHYLQVVSLFYLLSFFGNAFVGYFRGSGMVQIPVWGTTLHISIRVILSYWLIPKRGLEAVALATGIGWITVVMFQTFVYRRSQK